MDKINFQNLHGEECDIMLVDELFDWESPELAIIEDLYMTGELLPNSCSRNSKLVMETLNKYYGSEKVMYVEGYAVDSRNEKILHCWNVIDGKYFDVTAEYFWTVPSWFRQYHAHRLFNQKQYSHFINVGNGLTISMAEIPTSDMKHKFSFGNMGIKYVKKLSKKELKQFFYEDMIAGMNIRNHLSNSIVA